MDHSSKILDKPATADGRRQRSQRSREKIVAAMLKLVRGGEMSPSAAQVAETSGVSLRTVFRHFEEMDSLYGEMSAVIEQEIMPILKRPLTSSNWRQQIDELISKRIEVYEKVLPLKVSGSVRRFQSDYLKQDYDQFLKLERAGLKHVLPKSVTANAALFSALEMTICFEAWRSMRQDRRLSVKQAEAALRLAVDRLLAKES